MLSDEMGIASRGFQVFFCASVSARGRRYARSSRVQRLAHPHIPRGEMGEPSCPLALIVAVGAPRLKDPRAGAVRDPFRANTQPVLRVRVADGPTIAPIDAQPSMAKTATDVMRLCENAVLRGCHSSGVLVRRGISRQ